MNIKLFFAVILGILVVIFVSFKPLHVEKRLQKDIPVFELSEFMFYKLNTDRLMVKMYGKSGIKYQDRYEIKDINYTDKGEQFLSNIVAKNGVYNDEVLKLDGNITCNRDDGFVFMTQKATYDQKNKILISKTPYVAYLGKHIVRGDLIKYNNITKTIYSTHVVARYILDGEEKW